MSSSFGGGVSVMSVLIAVGFVVPDGGPVVRFAGLASGRSLHLMPRR
jgi:hypothetical protein